jgi:3-oxoacyl-[acyl-carrier protein] reductase
MPYKRVALITGASAGIGYATALEFARQGTHVVGIARRSERLLELSVKINALEGGHGKFLPVIADVQNADDMLYAVEQTMEKFGRLDVLVANAGIGHRGSIVDAKWDDLQTLLRTNIDGFLHSIRAAVPAHQATQTRGTHHNCVFCGS